MGKCFCILQFFFLLFSVAACWATPEITFCEKPNHGSSIKCIGTNFGVHNNNGEGRSQLCWIWDNCETYTNFSDAGWTDGQCAPNASVTGVNIIYSDGFHSVPQPHVKSTKYIYGTHAGNTSSTGLDVIMFAGGTEAIQKFYASWKYYEQSPFTYITQYNQLGVWDFRNNKVFLMQDQDVFYAGTTTTNYSYIDQHGLVAYTTDFSQIWIPTDYPSHTSRNIQVGGFGTIAGTTVGNLPNDGLAGNWENWEVEGNDLTSSGTSTLKVWCNGIKLLDLTSDNVQFTLRGIGIGGYRDKSNNTNFVKFFDDLYIDKTWARVVIGNASTFSSCTHREIQIPTAWSDTEISFTFNQGSFQSGDTAYLFVVDSDGNASAGYPITIGGTSLNTSGTLEYTGSLTIE